MNNKKYVIFTGPYNEDCGGTIVLHKLCSLLNDLGEEAYIFPYFNHELYPLTPKNWYKQLWFFFKNQFRSKSLVFKKNTSLNTRVFDGEISSIDESYITVYPETIHGNPLNAKNVVRWLLNQPGFFDGKVHYGVNELYYRYQPGLVSNFTLTGSKTSETYCKVIHFPTDIYNMEAVAPHRHGTAYLIKKGKGKKIVHDLSDSILIDDMSHKEIGKIFKRITTFISYDAQSAYSRFAALCGCKSIVIPDKGQTKEDWKPQPYQRLGISFGLEDDYCNNEQELNLLVAQIKKEEDESIANVKKFILETQGYFSN